MLVVHAADQNFRIAATRESHGMGPWRRRSSQIPPVPSAGRGAHS